ncbi:hypothetical protein C8A05DRAFT_37875 [Staphylotrichum tortipilum]|uniref:Uncharacterized protein n=1 Tax=Staphylotrichum tortipilum TaxID=2831512 RepID=A0AAN6MEC5_9PEZI|nr:hypothetical protein C8A05DRAFT_37875 [Staphylotrichum longicolle]
MAPPLTGMELRAFESVKDKAVSQLTYWNDKNCDVETMALEIAWLNNRYRDEGVYFALLRAEGLDLEAFPAPQVKKTFLFHQHQGIWSVACVKRRPDQVIMFDGTSEKPSDRLNEDRQRGIRLQRLYHAVKGQLAQLGIPDAVCVRQHTIVSHTNETFSATSCLAWAEAKFCRWPIDHNWDEFEHPCWLPSTDICSESAEMIVNGETD